MAVGTLEGWVADDSRVRLSHSPRVRTVCVVPRALTSVAADLEVELGTDVVVVVERRGGERRRQDRRGGAVGAPSIGERRRVRSETGRRLFERRGLVAQVDGMALPPRLRRFAHRLQWFEHVGRRKQVAEDAQAARLVARFQAGDQEAFVAIYERYFDRVYTFLNVLLRDHHGAEDVAQQTFIKAMQALPGYQLRAETPFSAWLFRIARNEGLCLLRKLGRVAPVEPQELDVRRDCPMLDLPVGEPFSWLSDADLMAQIERLPDAQRQVLAMRYLLGMKTEELAAALGRSPVAVRKLEHRALRFLEHRLSATRGGPLHGSRIRVSSLIRIRRVPVLRARRFALGAGPMAATARSRAW